MDSTTFIYEYTGDIRRYLDSVGELFKKLLRRGLLILHDLPSATIINENANAIVLLYRTALALVDALAELSLLPSVEAFKIVLRSFFETKCSVEYILEADTVKRAVAYQTQHIMNRTSQYKEYDSTTPEGQKFEANLKKDRLFGSTGMPAIDTAPAIQNLQSRLEREPFKTAYGKLSAKKRINWYSVDDGPKNFFELCDHLNYQMAYDFLYRQLSASVHATGAFFDSFFGEKGEGMMHALRALPGFKGFAEIALALVVDFLMQTTKKLLPNHFDRFQRFYKNIYKPYRERNIDPIRIST